MQHTLQLSMDVVPQVAKRKHHVLVLLRNAQGKFVLGSKTLYPDQIYRMVGGGIEEGEAAPPAAARELFEETGLELSPNELKPLTTITAEIEERSTGQHYTFVTELFLADVGTQQLHPSDDIQALQELTTEQLQDLIRRYSQLPREIDHDKGFAWYDYGQLYGAVHQIALDELHHVQ